MALEGLQGFLGIRMGVQRPLAQGAQGIHAGFLAQMGRHIEEGRVDVAPFFVFDIGFGKGNQDVGERLVAADLRHQLLDGQIQKQFLFEFYLKLPGESQFEGESSDQLVRELVQRPNADRAVVVQHEFERLSGPNGQLPVRNLQNLAHRRSQALGIAKVGYLRKVAETVQNSALHLVRRLVGKGQSQNMHKGLRLLRVAQCRRQIFRRQAKGLARPRARTEDAEGFGSDRKGGHTLKIGGQNNLQPLPLLYLQ